jgi:hypothetical protein
MNYDSKSGVFSAPGDSGAIVADIRGRMCAILTGGSGLKVDFDMTYGTLMTWVLKRIRASGYPHAHFTVD